MGCLSKYRYIHFEVQRTSWKRMDEQCKQVRRYYTNKFKMMTAYIVAGQRMEAPQFAGTACVSVGLTALEDVRRQAQRQA